MAPRARDPLPGLRGLAREPRCGAVAPRDRRRRTHGERSDGRVLEADDGCSASLRPSSPTPMRPSSGATTATTVTARNRRRCGRRHQQRGRLHVPVLPVDEHLFRRWGLSPSRYRGTNLWSLLRQARHKQRAPTSPSGSCVSIRGAGAPRVRTNLDSRLLLLKATAQRAAPHQCASRRRGHRTLPPPRALNYRLRLDGVQRVARVKFFAVSRWGPKRSTRIPSAGTSRWRPSHHPQIRVSRGACATSVGEVDRVDGAPEIRRLEPPGDRDQPAPHARRPALPGELVGVSEGRPSFVPTRSAAREVRTTGHRARRGITMASTMPHRRAGRHVASHTNQPPIGPRTSISSQSAARRAEVGDLAVVNGSVSSSSCGRCRCHRSQATTPSHFRGHPLRTT